MTAPATNVRLSPDAGELLASLAKELGESKTAIVEKALRRYRREQILRQASQRFAELREDPEAWAQIEAEREELEEAVGDGLD